MCPITQGPLPLTSSSLLPGNHYFIYSVWFVVVIIVSCRKFNPMVCYFNLAGKKMCLWHFFIIFKHFLIFWARKMLQAHFVPVFQQQSQPFIREPWFLLLKKRHLEEKILAFWYFYVLFLMFCSIFERFGGEGMGLSCCHFLGLPGTTPFIMLIARHLELTFK